MKNLRLIFLYIILFVLAQKGICQVPDSSNATIIKQKKKFYQTGLFKAVLVPAGLIGWGVSTIHGHGLYSSYDAYRDIHKLNFKHTSLDNYFQYVPYVELGALNLFNIRCKNDFVNTALLIVKSEILMNGVMWGLKYATHEIRPDSIGPARNQSFPSGHTANAFLAASLVHKEFKHRSIWYGIGAYAIATTVGAMRMINNRHWESDVFVGAGLGMLSVHLAYLTHRYRWGRNCNLSFTPTYNRGTVGLCLLKKF